MKYTVALLALVATVSAQVGNGQYNPFNPFNRNQNRYRPFSTPTPFRYRGTPSVTIQPTPFQSTTQAPRFSSTFAPQYSSTPAPFYSSTPAPFYASTRTPVLSADYNAETLKFHNENEPDGRFIYFFETSNGIAAQEEGVPRNFGGDPPVAPVAVRGSFSWTSPEGQPIAISYIADENGYHATGDAIPTPPPLPPQIARVFEYIARNGVKK